MINKHDFEKLLHDLKRIEKGIRLIENEKNIEKRKFIGSLLRDEADRLHADLEEMKEQNGQG